MLLPAPRSIRARGSALDRSLRALVKRGLAVEVRVPTDAHRWRTDTEGRCLGLAITAAGLATIGVEAESPSAARTLAQMEAGETTAPVEPAQAVQSSRPAGKLASLLEAVEREDGATLAEMAERTGWLPHTTRAALTRLRKRGFPIALETRDGRKAYRLSGATQ